MSEKVALVTGAARGIGRAIALALAKEGCRVVVTSRSRTDLEALVDEITAAGGIAVAVPGDLSVQADIDMLVARTVDQWGTIDFLINNAAVLHSAPFLEARVEEWDETMNVNLRSVFLLSQRALRVMQSKRSGYIINISSTVALGAKPGVAAYSVSKHGITGLSHALYAAAKEHGVRVSTIYPGVTDTPMLRQHASGVGQPEQWMQPEDIAYCVLFLLKQSPRMIVRELVPWAVQFDQI